MVLFNINQATLTRWYKNSTRRDEIKMLMQGRTPPPNIISQCPLPPPRELPLGPLPAPLQCHIFNKPEDTTGPAKVRGITPPAIVSIHQLQLSNLQVELPNGIKGTKQLHLFLLPKLPLLPWLPQGRCTPVEYVETQ